MNWRWVGSNLDVIGVLLLEHVTLALVPVLIGLAGALPLGFLAVRFPRAYPPMLVTSSVTYSIPSLALFVLFPVILGTQILDPVNVVAALTVYTVALLIRNVVDGLRATSDEVRQSAVAMGFPRWRQLAQVELPLALPLIFAGLRVATVVNISMVSVGALIGVGGLGELFTIGFQRDFLTPLLVGMFLSVALALLADALLVTAQRRLTPWTRVGRFG
ncbi:MAG: ABC transporter permease [Actinomycetota bacterium]|nr:ABC transporter permease [Actinomycetota bacterium]